MTLSYSNTYIPPLRFGTVNSNLYRGGYPTLRNFRFLRRFRLRTIISLTPEPPNADLSSFADIEKISIFHVQILRVAPLNNQLQGKLLKALQYLLDEGNLPAYIHCLDGCRITGLLVLLLRRIQFWAPQASFAEFWRFQEAYNMAVTDLERMSGDMDKFMLELNEDIIVPENIPKWLWGGQRNTLVPGLRLKHSPALETVTQKLDGTERDPRLPSSSVRAVSGAELSKVTYEQVGGSLKLEAGEGAKPSLARRQPSQLISKDGLLSDLREKTHDVNTKMSRSLNALALHGMDNPAAANTGGKRDRKYLPK